MHVLPYTTENLEYKGEHEGTDYHKADLAMFTQEDHEWLTMQKSNGMSAFWLQKRGTTLVEAPYIPYLKTTSMEARNEKIDMHITSHFGGPGTSHTID
jgi:hypothetical protein